MGLFKKLYKKLTAGFFYVVDTEVLMEDLKRNLEFSIEHQLELAAMLNLYLSGEKHEIMICNYAAYRDPEERKEGIGCFFDDQEYASLEELYRVHLAYIRGYFKVEDPNGDDVYLNDHMRSHPELRVEDYE